MEIASFYDKEGADEVVFLDITATHEGRKPCSRRGKDGAPGLYPLTVGGGIRTLEDFREILRAEPTRFRQLGRGEGQNPDRTGGRAIRKPVRRRGGRRPQAKDLRALTS